jgi:toluene monooxygenase electron transfer component
MKSLISLKNKSNSFDCDENDTLLRAAIRSGIKMPYECNSGGCGSCKFDLVEGEVETLWEDAPGLSPRDIRKGKKLACQCKAVTNCEIDFREENWEAPRFPPKRFKATFIERRDLTSDLAEFKFKSDDSADFMAAQYVMFSMPGVNADRAYSMSNISNKEGYWHFIIKKMPNGQASSFLFDELEKGDSLDLDGPYGLAYLNPKIDRNVVCIGGGSGLSPIMSVARTIISDKQFDGQTVTLFYGGRGPKDICTPELVEEIENSNNRITCHNATSDPELSAEHGWDGEVCFVHELVKNTLGESLPEYEFYFCGPPPMTEAVQRMLMIDYKVPFDQIHFDRFF